MIQFDTNFLIELVISGSSARKRTQDWLEQGREIGCCSVAWSEFCNGPVSRGQKDAVHGVLEGKILDFTWQEAEEAARLFNLSGRKRGSHPDCMIAACAILSGATVATRNVADFSRFVVFGLRLEPVD